MGLLMTKFTYGILQLYEFRCGILSFLMFTCTGLLMTRLGNIAIALRNSIALRMTSGRIRSPNGGFCTFRKYTSSATE
jgi:hypothetical protein